MTHRCRACFENHATPGIRPQPEPDSAVRDMRVVAAGIVALALCWAWNGLDVVRALGGGR